MLGHVGVRGSPARAYVTPGCGGRGEGLARPEFVMRRRRRRRRVRILVFWDNSQNLRRNSPNPDLAEKSGFPNGKLKNEFLAP